MTSRTTGFAVTVTGAMLGILLLLPPEAWAARKQADSAQQSQEKQQAVSPKVGKPLRAAQEAMQKEKWDEAYAKIQEAQAVSDQTPFDKFQISEMLGYVELKRQRYAEASAAFEQSVASGLLPPEQTTERLKIISQLALQLKDYPKAVQFAQKTIDATSTPDPNLYATLGQAQYLSENYPGAVEAMNRAIDSARQANKPVAENWLQVLLSGYVRVKDITGVLSTLQQLAVAYPSKKYLQDFFNQTKVRDADDRSVLNLYRLMFELGLFSEADDYLKMARLSVETGMPGEAVKVLEKGKASQLFNEEVNAERARRQLETARAAATADRKAMQALEQSDGQRSAEDEAQLGLALLSFQEYQRGAEALQRALSKGGLKRMDQAQLMLGQALVKLNRRDEAAKAFISIDAASKLKPVAELWQVYTREPSPLSS